MIKGKTDSGFEFEIREEVLDSYELIELLSELEDDPLKVDKLMILLLGEEQKKKLKEHVKKGKELTSVEDFTKEITDIFGKVGELKNS